jgi:hypothetical protein
VQQKVNRIGRRTALRPGPPEILNAFRPRPVYNGKKGGAASLLFFEVAAVRIRLLFACLVWVACCKATAWAQFQKSDAKGPKLGEALVQQWRAGMIITAGTTPCRGLVGTAPIPVDWPEQQTTIVEEDFSSTARVSYRTVEGTVKQMVVHVPLLPPREECRAIVTLEVKRSAQLPPDNTDNYVLPQKRKLPRDVLPYLGPSPGIECTSAKIKSLAKQFDVTEGKAWDQIEAIYDWVRSNVEHKQGNQGGALAALKDNRGDHEDLTSLFIALCRANNIPARTVWVPNHCYAEFYLEDDEGGGHWFPCQVAGSRAFGEMPDHRPILQKGDNFRSPSDRRERKRYLPETLDGAGGRPRVKFIRGLGSP